ncbi:MAG: hypothetical protein ABSA84_06615 [Gammaproteobacteria bacterium]|jgi:hypothetical protein
MLKSIQDLIKFAQEKYQLISKQLEEATLNKILSEVSLKKIFKQILTGIKISMPLKALLWSTRYATEMFYTKLLSGHRWAVLGVAFGALAGIINGIVNNVSETFKSIRLDELPDKILETIQDKSLITNGIKDGLFWGLISKLSVGTVKNLINIVYDNLFSGNTRTLMSVGLAAISTGVLSGISNSVEQQKDAPIEQQPEQEDYLISEYNKLYSTYSTMCNVVNKAEEFSGVHFSGALCKKDNPSIKPLVQADGLIDQPNKKVKKTI